VVFDDVPAWPGPSKFVTESLPKDYEYYFYGFNHFIARRSSNPDRTIGLELRRLMKLEGAEFVSELFRQLLGREPDAAGLAHHLRLLQQTRSKTWLITAIMKSAEAGLKSH